MTTIAMTRADLERQAAIWGRKTRHYLVAMRVAMSDGFESHAEEWAEQARLTAIYAATCVRLAEESK